MREGEDMTSIILVFGPSVGLIAPVNVVAIGHLPLLKGARSPS